jgi:hypothetical protein
MSHQILHRTDLEYEHPYDPSAWRDMAVRFLYKIGDVLVIARDQGMVDSYDPNMISLCFTQATYTYD